jgi:hypothetical protein
MPMVRISSQAPRLRDIDGKRTTPSRSAPFARMKVGKRTIEYESGNFADALLKVGFFLYCGLEGGTLTDVLFTPTIESARRFRLSPPILLSCEAHS